MTSKNLYSDNAGQITSAVSRASRRTGYTISQREMLKRRLWPAGLSLVLMLLYYFAGALLLLLSIRGSYAPDAGSSLRTQMIQNYSSFLRDGIGFLIASLLGVVLSLQGYAYLHNRKAVDFYESQPVKRSAHFWGIFLNSLLIYLISAVCAMLLSLLTGICFGAAGPGILLHGIGFAFLRDLAAFLACFAFGTLAAMLTGNPVVSILAVGVFFVYEMMMTFGIKMMMHASFYTFTEDSGIGFYSLLLNPVANALNNSRTAAIWRNVILAVPVMLLAYLAYCRRKNESAGQAVIFRPVRTIVKIAVAFLSGIITADVVWDLGPGTSIFCGLLAALLLCCLMEIIYHYDFRKLFAHPAELAGALILTAAVICIFRYDLFGYDSWIPKPESVKYASVRMNYENLSLSEEGKYLDYPAFPESYMQLTDTESVTALAESCLQAALNNQWDNVNDRVTINYTLQSGRTVSRRYPLNRSDPALLNAVTDSDEYRKGSAQIWHDQFMDKLMQEHSVGMYYTVPGSTQLTEKKIDYNAFRKAYRTDLEMLNYNYADTHPVIGCAFVSVPVNNRGETIQFSNPVYEGFEQTTAFLKANGLYQESRMLNADEIERIEVRLSSYTLPDGVSADESTSPDGVLTDESNLYKEYTDPAEIHELIQSAMHQDTDFNAPLLQTSIDHNWTLIVYLKDNPDDYRPEDNWMNIRAGKIPSFVLKDFAPYIP